ncbi:carbonic anhydrase 3-like [Pollicipes pollicipes]|uniref:carbonic anhydrase 3-like n=1 Tax=Pollicipes pollicipes TaxID=41117 RepID=UPI001884BA07|nr:carbonic anhydrase 3-like [Pollicipes pollicipes]
MILPWWLLLVLLKSSPNVLPGAYDYTEPARWREVFPMCGGPMQSPIALTPTRYALSRTPKLKFAKGLSDGQIEAVNTGRALKLTLRPKNRDKPLLRLVSYSKPMIGIYTFAQMHFHWADGSGLHGSEHAIGGNYTDAEAHFVFYNSRYPSIKEAVRHFDGLLVVGTMLRGSEDKQQFLFPTVGMEDRLGDVLTPGKKLKVEADLRDFSWLLRRAVLRFYSYHGSLTTPPCNPVVTWMVASTVFPVRDKFLKSLRKLHENDDSDGRLVHNCRPVQPTHGRVVTQHISVG